MCRDNAGAEVIEAAASRRSEGVPCFVPEAREKERTDVTRGPASEASFGEREKGKKINGRGKGWSRHRGGLLVRAKKRKRQKPPLPRLGRPRHAVIGNLGIYPH